MNQKLLYKENVNDVQINLLILQTLIPTTTDTKMPHIDKAGTKEPSNCVKKDDTTVERQ